MSEHLIFDGLKVVALLVPAILYALGCSRLRRDGSASVPSNVQILSFALGMATLGTALVSPLHHAAEDVLWLHMVQHLMLVLLAPLLLVASRPLVPFLCSVGPSHRRAIARSAASRWAQRAFRTLSIPPLAWALHVAVLWLWHAPALYDRAVTSEPLHALEHASFFITALLFWSAPFRRERRVAMAPGTALLYVFLGGVQSTALGALLTFAQTPLFSTYEQGTGGLSAIEDQQLAGLVMWIPAGVVYVAAAAFIFVQNMRKLDRRGGDAARRKMVLPPLILFALIASFGLLGPGTGVAGAQVETPPPGTDPPPDAYLADCAYCHGVGGEGTELGPSLEEVGRASADFMLRTGRMPIEDAEEYPERKEVAYDEATIVEIVDYVGSLGGGPDIPIVDPAAGDLVEGEQLYIDNCAACHATTGIGGALTDEAIAPPLNESSPIEIAEAIRVGGNGREGSMPVFGPSTFSQEELDSVVRYVIYLQDPGDPGGAGLGRLGPIAEGFVGWFFGLGALILVILWIGDRGESPS